MATADDRAVVESVHAIAVVGAGLVGGTAALTLAELGYSVVLYEASPPVEPEVPGDAARDAPRVATRNVALSPASREVLDGVGVWPSEYAAPFGRMQVWERRGSARLSFGPDANAGGKSESVLGWIVEVPPLVHALWKLACAHPRITVRAGVSPDALCMDGSALALGTGSATDVVQLIVAADGARSSMRTLAGLHVRSEPTGHHALATVVGTTRPHGNVARQVFLPGGPLALLPSRDPQTVSVVWSQPEATATQRCATPPSAFCDELTQLTESCVGQVRTVGERIAFPVVQSVAHGQHPSGRVVLVGDAARVLHPLAGLGVNLGFEDVAALSRVLRRHPTDPGSVSWSTFARRRRARSEVMVRAMALLQQTFGATDPGFAWLRNLGVRWIDGHAGIKHQLAREAMGLGPFAQRLGRG